MLDFGKPYRAALIADASAMAGAAISPEELAERAAIRLAAKRLKAISVLGDGFILHPNYSRAAHANHDVSHKSSAVLMAFLLARGAFCEGRV